MHFEEENVSVYECYVSLIVQDKYKRFIFQL